MRALLTILAISITALIMWAFRYWFYWFLENRSSDFINGFGAGMLLVFAIGVFVLWVDKRFQRR